jgi:hypothetical protein
LNPERQGPDAPALSPSSGEHKVRFVENRTWTLYIRARGPDRVDTIEQSRLLSTGNFGGSVVYVSSGRLPLAVVVEMDAPTEEAAYELVIAKMSAVLGANWTVEPDPG